jgi:RimJ/RimL family protein N-acetyltransferase
MIGNEMPFMTDELKTRSHFSIGLEVEPSPGMLPRRAELRGQYVTVTPLDLAVHGDVLYEQSTGPDREHLWLYLWEGPFAGRGLFDADLARKAESRDPMFYAIVENKTGLALGRAAYLRIEPQHRVIEVGHILYTPRLQRTTGATEAMYLMAKHAFEDLGYRRYEWKCNSLNAPSRATALRLGFSFEGIFRQHMIVKGRNRDTAWYAMLDSEWPARKAAFQRWLDLSNFDAEGKQKRRLSTFDMAK